MHLVSMPLHGILATLGCLPPRVMTVVLGCTLESAHPISGHANIDTQMVEFCFAEGCGPFIR
jgi:hypothetical protein